MNFDIRLSVGFWQHPKTRRLEKACGLKGVRSLQILMCWTAQNRPDGVLTGLDAEDIEFAADWRGKKGKFFEACNGQWLDEAEDGSYSLHEWSEYNPYQAQAEQRSEAARKAAQARWAKACAQAEREQFASDTGAYAGEEQEGDAGNAGAYAPETDSICGGNADADAGAYADAMRAQCERICERNAPIPIPVKELKTLTPPTPLKGGDGCGETPNPAPETEKPEAGSGRKPRRRRGSGSGDTLPELRAQMQSYTGDQSLLEALESFRAMRERIRKPMTGEALRLTLRELDKLAGNDCAAKVAVLEQSIQRSWQGVFPLRDCQSPLPRAAPRTFAELDEERFKRELLEAQERDRMRAQAPIHATIAASTPAATLPQRGITHD